MTPLYNVTKRVLVRRTNASMLSPNSHLYDSRLCCEGIVRYGNDSTKWKLQRGDHTSPQAVSSMIPDDDDLVAIIYVM